MIKKYASAEILFNEAEKLGLNPVWDTPHGLFSFRHKGQDHYVFYTKLHINSQLGSWMCQDKFLTHTMLKKHGFPHIPFCYSTHMSDIHRFFDEHHPIIQKPVLGQKSENTYLINAQNEIRKDALDTWMFEKYIPGDEYRCLVLQGKVIAMQQKKVVPTPEYPWRKTFRTLESSEWNEEMVTMAVDIAQLFHMGFIAVDFILDKDTKIWILETNSIPGLYSFHHPDQGQSLNIAKEILTSLLS